MYPSFLMNGCERFVACVSDFVFFDRLDLDSDGIDIDIKLDG